MTIRRIGLLTGGGDCPGLNAVIRAVVLDAAGLGIEVVGILDGYLGLIEDRTRPLGVADAEGILTQGGTILGASNKSNPARFAVGRDERGAPVIADVTPRCLETIRRHGLEALLIVGGDGTMAVAQIFVRAGINCIGIPKTIDNDLSGTELTFGFHTAVAIATDALDRVRTTAASHHRVIAVEVMGRRAGWIALYAGIASGADFILIPEIPFEFASVCHAIQDRCRRGLVHSIICIAEGAAPRGGEQVVARLDPASPDPVRFGGIAQRLAAEIEASTGSESRHVVLGHVQRGGTPIAADRILATQFGHHAMRLLRAGVRNRMVAYRHGAMDDIDIAIAAEGLRLVDPANLLISGARLAGARFGDEPVV